MRNATGSHDAPAPARAAPRHLYERVGTSRPDRSRARGAAEPATAPAEEPASIGAGRRRLLRAAIGRNRALLGRLAAHSLLTNLFALAVPVYVMHVCDRLTGAQSGRALSLYFAGVCIIVLADLVARTLRARALSHLGERCERELGLAVLRRLLSLPLERIERAGAAVHLSRMRWLESLRGLFGGAIASALLDMPFVPLAVGAAFLLGGAAAWPGVVGAAVYGLVLSISAPIVRARTAAAARADEALRGRLVESVSRRDALRLNAAEDVWLDRLRQSIGDAVLGRFRERQLDIVLQTLSRMVILLAACATLWAGTHMIADRTLTDGGLVAVMMLNWRALAPFHAAFQSVHRLSLLAGTMEQLAGLAALAPEPSAGQRTAAAAAAAARTGAAAIDVARVSYRHEAGSVAAISGVDLSIPAGQFVVLAGPEGAGKTTLLKLVAGLYLPSAGSVRIDGRDTRGVEAAALRNAMAFVPHTGALFDGTIDDNLRLVRPAASEADIENACRDARLSDYARALPRWRSTVLGDEERRVLPDGLKQRLMLARAWVNDAAPLVLLDEPASHLDAAGARALVDKLNSLRGRATIIMATHRPDHMRMADRLVLLDRGRIVQDGTPERVVPLLAPAA